MSKSSKSLPEKEPNNPVPVRMGELKGVYRMEAFRQDRSMQWLILQALKTYSKSFPK